MSDGMAVPSDRLISPSADGGELGYGFSGSASLSSTQSWASCDLPHAAPKKRRRRLRRETRFATLVSAASLLISLATVALVMWFTSDIGPKVNQLKKLLLSERPPLAPEALGGLESSSDRAAESRNDRGGDGYLVSNKTPSKAPEEPAATAATKTSFFGSSSSWPTQPTKWRGYECTSNTIDTRSRKAYPDSVNVTKWRTSDRLFSPCPVVTSDSAELRIEEDGHYLLYSQAWLSGGMNKGVVLERVRDEQGARSLRIKHSIVGWRNCIGVRDRFTGAVPLREAEITALDVLNTYVVAQVWLPGGATVGVMVTSSNVTGTRDSAWTKVVLGVVRLDAES